MERNDEEADFPEDEKICRRAKGRQTAVNRELHRQLKMTRESKEALAKQLEKATSNVEEKDRESKSMKCRFDRLTNTKKQLDKKNEELHLKLSETDQQIDNLRKEVNKWKQRSNEFKKK